MRHIVNGLHCITVLDDQVFFVSSAEQCCSTAVQSTERCTSVPHGLVFIPDKNYPDWGLLSGKRQRELQLKIKNCNLRPVLSFWWSTGSENLLRRSRHTAEIKASYQLFNPMVCGVFTVGRSISTAPQASLWLSSGAQRHAPFIYSKSNYSGALGNHSKMFKTKWLVLWIKTCPIPSLLLLRIQGQGFRLVLLCSSSLHLFEQKYT